MDKNQEKNAMLDMKKIVLALFAAAAVLQLPTTVNALLASKPIETIAQSQFDPSADTLSMFRDIELQWLNAVKDSSKPMLKQMMQEVLSEDFVYQHGSGRILSKAEYVKLLFEGEITVETLGALDLSVRDYGDTVISYGSSPMSGQVFGNPYAGRLRFVNVWHKDEDDRWRLTHRNSELLSE
jgi:ketosteroid isomerase-like protein